MISATGRVNLARQSNYRLGQSVRLTIGKGAEQVLGPVRTAGQQARVANQLGASETMRVLWETYPTQLSLYMVRSGVSVTLLVDRMHSEAALALFEEDGEEEGPVLLSDGGYSQPQRYQDTITAALADETISDEVVERTVLRIDRLDGDELVFARQFVIDTGPAGVQTAAAFETDGHYAEVVTVLYGDVTDRRAHDQARLAAQDLVYHVPIAELAGNMAIEEIVSERGETAISGAQFGIELQVDYPRDSEQWVRTVGGMGDADLSKLNSSQRAAIAETYAGPTLVEERGLEILYLEAPGETGFDIVAYDDEADEYVIIEAKFRSTSGSVSNSSVWLDRPVNKAPQMTDEWIEETIDEMIASNDIDVAEIGVKLDEANDEGKLRKELIVVQNEEQNGLTVLKSLTEDGMSIHHVHIVKLKEVTE